METVVNGLYYADIFIISKCVACCAVEKNGRQRNFLFFRTSFLALHVRNFLNICHTVFISRCHSVIFISNTKLHCLITRYYLGIIGSKWKLYIKWMRRKVIDELPLFSYNTMSYIFLFVKEREKQLDTEKNITVWLWLLQNVQITSQKTSPWRLLDIFLCWVTPRF